jgi:uncharacterized protein YerC
LSYQDDINRIRALPDALERYREATTAARRAHQDADFLDTLRAFAVAGLHTEGRTYQQIAAETGLSVPRVGQLVVRARERLVMNVCGERRQAPRDRTRTEKCVLWSPHQGEHQFEYESEAPTFVVERAVEP